MRWRRRWRHQAERGAIATLVLVLLGGGALTGAGALAIDVSQLYVEREELQSGADAAAQALAKKCAVSPSTCDAQATTAKSYADTNAKDGHSKVAVICGTGTGLPACSIQPDTLSACPPSPPAGMPYVEVRTSTEQSNGSTILPPTFAKSLLGNGSYSGTRVNACARVAWGAPTSATGLAIGVSQCNWQVLTTSGASLPSDEHVIYLHDPHDADPDSGLCAKGPGGTTAPGGFGYADADAGTCIAIGSVPSNWDGSPGNSSHDCETPLTTYRSSKQAVPLPIYDTVSGTGSGTTYHMVGFASFVVTGWLLSGTSMASNVPPGSTSPHPATSYCSGADRCLYGYFTRTTLSTANTGGAGTGPNFGASVVSLVG